MSDIDRGTGNPFAPPTARVEDAAPVIGDLAGRTTRLAAAVIDGLAFLLLFFAMGLLASVNIWQPSQAGSGYWLAYGASLVGFFAFQAYLLHRRSQTLGKVAMGVRIVRADGSPAGIGRLIGMRMLPMWLISLVPVVGPLLSLVDSLLIFRASHRCLHDDIADTIVVRA